MLANIKQKSSGWVSYLIVGLITIPFALFGVQQYLTGNTNLIVAKVGGMEIQQNEYLLRFNQQKRNVQKNLGPRYNQSIESLLKNKVIESIINEKLLAKFSDNLHLVTTNKEIKDIILTNTSFFENGKFSFDKYTNLLRLNGYSVAQYEDMLLTRSTESQINNNIADFIFSSVSAKKRLEDLINQQRKISYLEIKNSDFAKKVKISNQEISDFYEKNKNQILEPKQIKVDFIELNRDNIAKKIKWNDEDLETTYQEEKSNFSTTEERKAQHILVKDKKLAADILKQLKNGANFVKLAKQYSIDTSNNKKGGDLGFFQKGVMVPEFEKAVFSMKEGDLSDIISTDFGYHIVKLNKIKPQLIKKFDEVKDEIIKIYQKNTAQQQMFALSEKMANSAYEAQLEDVASELGLKLQTTDFFTTNNSSYVSKFINTSFSDAVVVQNENALVEINQNQIFVIRKNQFKPAKQKTLKDAKEQIKRALIKQKTAKLSKNLAEKIVKNKKQNKKQKWSNFAWVSRVKNSANENIKQNTLNFAFTMHKPKKQQTIYKYIVTPDGVTIVRLNDIKISSTKTDLTQLNNLFTNVLFSDIIKYLRKDEQIEIYFNLL